jgi:putative methyltransferase (TIGR04325 family)
MAGKPVMNLRNLLKGLTPPLAVTAARQLLGNRAEWEACAGFTQQAGGWNVADAAFVYRRKWPAFLQQVRSGGVLGVPPDAVRSDGFDVAFHNTVMCFAHALATAAGGRSALSLLDWGCALGHYRIFAERLMPGVVLDYTGRDLRSMVAEARQVQPDATFHDTDVCLDQCYDLVMASTSLQYEENWRELAGRLVRVARGWIYITGLPVVQTAKSFPFVQRAQGYGYNTEYVAWALNRTEFLAAMESSGASLRHEYALGYRPPIKAAPEQCEYRGFLFKINRSH